MPRPILALHLIPNRHADLLKSRHHSPFVLLENELSDCIGAERPGEFLDGFTVLVIRTGNQVVDVGRFGALDNQGILGGFQSGFERVIGIDQSQIHLVQNAGQGGRVQFFEIQVFQKR
ncbi:hypothetical protein ABIE59_000557 [Marinobacter sp. MBR-99]